MRAGAAEVRQALWRHLRAPVMTAELWLATAFVTIGTNLLDFATVPLPGERPGALFAAAAAVRVLLVFWIGYAVARQMGGAADPWRPRLAFVRYSALSVALLILFGLATRIGLMLVPGERTIAGEWVAVLLVVAAWSVLTIRLVGWGPALALDAPFRDLPRLWAGLRGAGVALAMVFVQVVLPFAAIHYALTLVGVRLPLDTPALAALAVVDGVVSAVQLVLTVALGVVAWRIARDAAGLRGTATAR